jgi:hypothetical protein
MRGLALACSCYGLPGSWDISHIPQAVWGEGKDSTWVPSACVLPTLKLETDESKGELEGNVHAIGFGIKQSNFGALSEYASQSHYQGKSLCSYMYHGVYISQHMSSM